MKVDVGASIICYLGKFKVWCALGIQDALDFFNQEIIP